jgi:hypothetical protein
VGGASDVLYLATSVKDGFNASSKYSMNASVTKDAISDLKAGKIDAAIIGRELTVSESESLEMTPIAFDAICILISRDTYEGGIMTITIADNVVKPIAKFSGLENLTIDQLRQHYKNLLYINPKDKPWINYDMGVYDFVPIIEGTDYSAKVNPKTNTINGKWVFKNVRIQGSLSPDGLFDTQYVILQQLGLEDTKLDVKTMDFLENQIDSEELWISSRFLLKTTDGPFSSLAGFSFFLIPASREVTLRAIQHGFNISALKIDGIDPLSSPQVIYDGTYPLSRKIYMVTPKSSSTVAAQEFRKFLLSTTGQKLIENASFLPLSSTQ